MSAKLPLVSIVVLNLHQGSTLRVTLDSILNQEDARVELFVVDQGAEQELAREYAGRVAGWERATADDQVIILNRVFAETRGDVLWWLAGADKLCPWAVRVTSFVLQNLPQIQWLTSGTPLLWTRGQMCVPGGLADGYNKRAFFAGRNLKSSPYFHFPIWRAGTVWRRELWQASGAQIRFPLEQAGDFELWTRFWQHAELAALHVPFAGTQSAAAPVETASYWDHATAYLDACGKIPAPSSLQLRAQQQLMRRIPALRERWTQPAPLVWISPPTLECGLSSHAIL